MLKVSNEAYQRLGDDEREELERHAKANVGEQQRKNTAEKASSVQQRDRAQKQADIEAAGQREMILMTNCRWDETDIETLAAEHYGKDVSTEEVNDKFRSKLLDGVAAPPASDRVRIESRQYLREMPGKPNPSFLRRIAWNRSDLKGLVMRYPEQGESFLFLVASQQPEWAGFLRLKEKIWDITAPVPVVNGGDGLFLDERQQPSGNWVHEVFALAVF